MLLTLEAPSTALLGKTRQAPSRCSSWTRPERVSKIRHRDCSASVAAASMNLQPWHSMDRDSTSSTAAALCYALKQLAMHQSRPKASLQQAPHPVWHGIELQRHSNAGQPSEACSGAIAAAASAALRIPSPDSLQGTLNCLVLAETVYRASGQNYAEVANVVSALQNDFPSPSLSLQQLQWSLPHVLHRYMLAEDKDALYACFIGTKQRRDIATNANIMRDALWPDLKWASQSGSKDLPAAHAGFLSRARDIPAQDLYKLARQKNKRLVLTGHSLGGAVALLCMLDLLQKLGDEAVPNLSCVGFATPAVGNAALAEYVNHRGWDILFTNYLVPEDVITRLLPSSQGAAVQAVGQAADTAAEKAAGPAHPALWAPLVAQPSSSSPSSSPSAASASPSSISHSAASASLAGLPSTSLKAASDSESQSSASSYMSAAFGDVEYSSRTQKAPAHKAPVLPMRSKPLQVAGCKAEQHSSHSSQHKRRSSAEVQHGDQWQKILRPALAARSASFCSNNILPLQGKALSSWPASLLSTSLKGTDSSTAATARQTNRPCGVSAQPALVTCDPSSFQQQQLQQANEATPAAGMGLWARTAQLARLVTFPVRATRAYHSYVPFGQQLYLNPQAVATSLDKPFQPRPAAATPSGQTSAAATAAGPSAAALSPRGLPDSQADPPAALADLLDLVVQQRRGQLGRLWMHRMPTYRARFQQILFAAMGLPLPQGSPGTAPQAQGAALSTPIAPVIQLLRAETSASALTSQHLKGILQDGMNAVPPFCRLWAWSGVWPAIRHRLYSREQDTMLHIAVQGHGLQHATQTHVTFASETLSSSIGQHPSAAGPAASLLSRAAACSALQAVFAVLLVGKPAMHMVLRVSVPARLMRKMQQQLAATGGAVGMQVTMQSDFCSSSVPVLVQSDVKALQNRVAGMLAICRLESSMQHKSKNSLLC